MSISEKTIEANVTSGWSITERREIGEDGKILRVSFVVYGPDGFVKVCNT